uniref:myoD family inhibitor domain-containing protein 2-like n=1 Tax=Doryrhamphus excisus TaxID=161450 RepID=UPI0025AEA066|nr:myoD family inhibitor domain-containing protein 2-like [Doryrhamphus excisus]
MTTSPSAAPETHFVEIGKKTQNDESPVKSSGHEEQDTGWDGGSDSLKTSRSSVFSSDDSHQPVTGEDCAELLLACLYCRFHDFLLLLQDTSRRALDLCFPSLDYTTQSSQRDHQGWEGWECNLGLDWDLCNSCQDSAELLELAMEISEVCYR